MVVDFMRKTAGVRVVSISRQSRVMNHSAFEVEASVSQVEDKVDTLILVQVRRGTAQDLAFAQRRYLRDEDIVASRAELLRCAVERGVELNCTYHRDRAAGFEISLDGCEEVLDVYLYIHEHIQSLDFRDVDGYETAMRVVDQDIAAERSRRIIVYTACAVRDITHDERARAGAELGQDVGDGGGEEEEAFWHLKGDFLGA